ncbi:energy-coupling factor transporter ATPase [Methanolacinia paynteri]|uniref:energy-coupling factor transporter ATPase n=1 Tax=Methanolacinia paynteri TaxID=230356 RepID=UPI000693B5E7|nr:energy-coupling factor transporter ATPase [Methanolacinia paynteri]
MKSKDIAIVGILLAIGAILRYFSNIIPGAIVANPIIALYCLAIILIAPRARDALGIGIVAGIVSALISHSIFPPGNLISEPVGALVCLGVYSVTRKRLPFSPGISTLVATLASGFTFLFVSIIVIVAGIIPLAGQYNTIGAFVVTLSPIVIATSVFNAVITQVLYFPSSRILMRGIKGEAEPAPVKAEVISPVAGEEEISPVAVEFKDYTYNYPAGKRPALSSINLKINRGECVLINGTTGAGKTTLCLAAAGILHHEYEGREEGTISIFGRDVSSYTDMGDIGKHVGVVFDDADAQLIFTTVEEEVLSGLENRGLEADDVVKRLEDIMKLTNIEHLRYRSPHTLSGGQKQRVALASTLASGTDCLILDEATAELDTVATEQIITVLTRLKNEGKTIIVVEQKPKALSTIADRVIFIDNGRLVNEISPSEFFSEKEKEEAEKTVTFGYSLKEKISNGCGEPVVSIRDLVHDYGGGFRALDGISVDFYPGEFIAIIGENGSGKTTLSKHLNGLLKPTSGTVMISGIDSSDSGVIELSRHVGLVFQNPDTMLFEDTIEREIEFGLKNISMDYPEGYIDEVIDEVGLSEQKGAFPRSMSRGERQRLAIACVVAMKPKVILLDEPTTGLDPVESERIMNILEGLSGAGHTIIMVSHDLDIVRNHAARIIKMADGKIVSDTFREVNE